MAVANWRITRLGLELFFDLFVTAMWNLRRKYDIRFSKEIRYVSHDEWFVWSHLEIAR